MQGLFRTAAMAILVTTAALANDTPAPRQSAGTNNLAAPADANGDAVETIVFLRHGEKPADGLGQITPQGLNRALALSEVLPKMFGKPDFLFAPDPRQRVGDAAGLCYYVRPLATIEPTAIRLGMQVQTFCGYRDIDELDEELCKPQYERATVFVAWEHGYARLAVADLFKAFGGDPKRIPSWPGADYDSLYVVRIHRSAGKVPTATFTHEHEGLDGLSTAMPKPAAK